MRRAALLLLTLGAVVPAAAQTLPLRHSSNPMAESRSGLYYQPWVTRDRPWQFEVGFDYASMVEYGLGSTRRDTTYLLDAETYRINLSATHNLGARNFVLAEAFVGGVRDGFMDGFLDWYHGLFGISYPERNGRPQNQFGGYYRRPDGGVAAFEQKGAYFGDLRLGAGHRFGEHLQSALSLTLPTSTGGASYARGVVSVSLLNTVRARVADRLGYEGSLSFGYTPTDGRLAEVQQTFFFQGTSGLRWRMAKRLSAYTNFSLHSPYYQDAGPVQLDHWDFAIDFGGAIRGASGREFRFGMTEDLAPNGSAVDAVFRFGYAW